ncbi:MAG: hypothetical protein WDN49_25080 [Acetobacteraceae bacterium]
MEDSAIASLLALADGAADQAARLARLEETLAGEGVAAQIAAEAGALRQAIDERLGRVEALGRAEPAGRDRPAAPHRADAGDAAPPHQCARVPGGVRSAGRAGRP